MAVKKTEKKNGKQSGKLSGKLNGKHVSDGEQPEQESDFKPIEDATESQSGSKWEERKADSEKEWEEEPEAESERDWEEEQKIDSEEEWEDEEWEEEPDLEEGDARPWMTFATFGVLVVLAALICVLLWNLTHRDDNTDTDMPLNTHTAVNEDVRETLVEDITSGGSESEGANEPEGNGEMSGDLPEGSQLSTENQTAAGNGNSTAGTQMSSETDGNSGNSSGNTNVSGEVSASEPVSGDSTMTFREVSETVTAKDVTNLRSVPSTEDAENVVTQLLNGSSLERTGINDATGWSRLNYNGETVYAVTQFLTTDLNYKPPVAAGNPNRISTIDGRVIIFADCDDHITPKEYVNLRTEPSTSQGNDTVRCQVNNGESVHRTGYSPDSGWSRVEYNGEVLYVVSSLVVTAE